MANTNGIFTDLFNAVGTPIQNTADSLTSGIDQAVSLCESCINCCAAILTSSIDTAAAVFKNVAESAGKTNTPKI